MLKTTRSKYRTAIEIEYQILKTIIDYPELTMNSLLSHVHMTDSTKFHKYLDPLIKKKFIDLLNYKRNNTGIEDQRIKILKITDKGKEHLNIIEQYMKSVTET